MNRETKITSIYVLSGDSTGIQPGERMTLEAKRRKTDKMFVFETRQ
jgi:hypothetical protein